MLRGMLIMAVLNLIFSYTQPYFSELFSKEVNTVDLLQERIDANINNLQAAKLEFASHCKALRKDTNSLLGNYLSTTKQDTAKQAVKEYTGSAKATLRNMYDAVLTINQLQTILNRDLVELQTTLGLNTENDSTATNTQKADPRQLTELAQAVSN